MTLALQRRPAAAPGRRSPRRATPSAARARVTVQRLDCKCRPTHAHAQADQDAAPDRPPGTPVTRHRSLCGLLRRRDPVPRPDTGAHALLGLCGGAPGPPPARADRADALRRGRGRGRAARAAQRPRHASGLRADQRLGGRAAPAGPAGARLHAARPGRQDGHARVAARAAGGVRVHLLDLPRHLPGAGADDPRRARRPAEQRPTCGSIGISRRPGQRHPQARAVVPAQAADDRADAVPARHAARSCSRSGRRSRSSRSRRRSSTPPTPCWPTRTGFQRIGFPFDQLTEEALAHDLARLSSERALRRAEVLRRVAPVPAGRAGRVREGPRARATCARTSSRRPGSGKTLLGVELIRRVGKRALVLAPNQGIQQQWPRAVGEFTPHPADDRRRRPAEADRLPLLPGAVPARGPRDRARAARAVALGGRARRRPPA